MFENMQTPSTRAEFERRFYLLRERIRQGKFFVNQGISLGFLKVRQLPNGRIDFLSVNESARLQANMIAQFEDVTFRKMIDNEGIQNTPIDGAQEYTKKIPKE